MQSAAHITDHQIAIESTEPEVYGPGRVYVDLWKAVRDAGAAADVEVPEPLHAEAARNSIAEELDHIVVLINDEARI
jgi:hypothetical protein